MCLRVCAHACACVCMRVCRWACACPVRPLPAYLFKERPVKEGRNNDVTVSGRTVVEHIFKSEDSYLC